MSIGDREDVEKHKAVIFVQRDLNKELELFYQRKCSLLF